MVKVMYTDVEWSCTGRRPARCCRIWSNSSRKGRVHCDTPVPDATVDVLARPQFPLVGG